MISPILVTTKDQIRTIVFNRPHVLNAIDLDTAFALWQALVDATKDDTRAVIITGQGRGFCAGGDLKFAHTASPDNLGEAFLQLTTVLHDCVREIRQMSKPVIAAINGPAVGAGLFLALASDLRVMAETAYLKQSNTSYGLSLPAGGTFNLPRLVGMGRALEIILLDEKIPAARALELGLVTSIAPDHSFDVTAYGLAQRVSTMPIETIGRVKQLMNQAFDQSLSRQLDAERQAIAISANSTEGREGVAAFVEKRKPQFVTL